MDCVRSYGTVRVIKTDVETSKVVFDKTFKNQITNYALTQAAMMWAGQSGVIVPTRIAVGNGSPPVGQTSTTPGDYALWSEITGTRRDIDYTITWLQYYTQYSLTYQNNEAQGPITEAGLLDADGNLWSHVIFADLTHDTTSTLSIMWQIQQIGN